MSKKYKGRTCTYCGQERASTCADHVIAREFFLPEHRGNLPKVPICDVCNRTKSILEHYLTALLPFGGRHQTAETNLREMVPKRLTKNARLHRQIRRGQGTMWAQATAGLLVPTMTLPVDNDRLLQLFKMIVRGLAWHHWQIRFRSNDELTAMALTRAGERIFDRQFALNAAARVEENLGEGTFWYEGAQGVDLPEVTIWRLSMYGGMHFGDPDLPGEVATRIGVLTGPEAIKTKARLAQKFGLKAPDI